MDCDYYFGVQGLFNDYWVTLCLFRKSTSDVELKVLLLFAGYAAPVAGDIHCMK